MKKMDELNRPIKILVINANNWFNKGDVSNRVGFIYSIKKMFGKKAEICIESRTPDKDSGYFYNIGADVVESIYNNGETTGITVNIRKLFRILTLINCYFIYRCFGYISENKNKSNCFFKRLVDADIVVSSPGGFLQDYHIYQSLLPHIFLIFLAEIAKKPVVIYAQSVGPFRNPITKFASKIVFNKANLITLRESTSKDYLNEAGIQNPHINVTADASFSFTIPTFNRSVKRIEILTSFNKKINKPVTLIGLSILGEYFFTPKRSSFLDSYTSSIASFIDHVSESINANVVVVPQVVSKTEFAVMRLIFKKVKHKDHILLVQDDRTPQEIMELIGAMDIMVGNRTHSCIYALNMNIPILAIAYEHKTLGIMRMLNLEQWVVDITNVSSELIAKFDELYPLRDQVRAHIISKIPDLKSKSLDNASLVLDLAIEKGLLVTRTQ